MKKKFLQQFKPDDTNFDTLPAYGSASFNTTLKSMLQQYNTSPPSDALSTARQEIDSVKDIMTENIERVLERGERIDLLVDKTDRLGGSARDFRGQESGSQKADVVEECQGDGATCCGRGLPAISLCRVWVRTPCVVEMCGKMSSLWVTIFIVSEVLMYIMILYSYVAVT